MEGSLVVVLVGQVKSPMTSIDNDFVIIWGLTLELLLLFT